MQSASPPFRKVLIANRGEIACRVIRTLSGMGIASVAIHHPGERRARHALLADEAVEIDGETPVAAHLDGRRIVDVAIAAGADAIHPGYGFLSENAGFARMVEEAGLTFIGPEAESIRLMGDKIESRRFAEAHGVPVAPSVLPTGDLDQFLAEAESIGFPLLIKASAGGGGKGMSIVRSRDELAGKARTAAAEAERYFGDGRIYAELYVERPRHIEVQVVGDAHGTVVHLFERECSVQRRFQKIVEEAPSAGLPEETRLAICGAAVRLARAAGYRNAGTVEFILAPDGRFFFLEMNTRLQVEHPVTEMVTGIDLVRLQIEIAAGRPLPFRQEDVRLTGHAVECRICAEDPANGFLPQTGRILKMDLPAGPHIRFENGLIEGQAVTASFDPMLAKLVVHGESRAAAIDASLAALADTVLLGVGTNIDYLTRLIGHRAFRDGTIHTGFVDQHAAELMPPDIGEPGLHAALIAAALGFREFRTLAFDVPEPYAAMGGWRN